MLQTRMIGDIKVSRALEYAAPTHDPAFLFPDLPLDKLSSHAHALAPHHFVPEMNRLIITIQIWIVKTPNATILIDTGVGNFKQRAAARMNQLNGLLPFWLEAAGASFNQVTHVVHTHLHSDHVGWNTVLRDGRWAPSFPNARYYFPRIDYDHYTEALLSKPDPIIDHSFSDSVVPIIESGLANFVTHGDVIADCLTAEFTPGHSHGHTAYRLESRGQQGLFSGDVMHSPVQILEPSLNTTYCALPDIARKTRVALLETESKRGTLVMPMHFGIPHCGYIRNKGAGFAFEAAEWDNDFR